MLARSSPVASETRLVALPAAAEAGVVVAACAEGKRIAAAAAAPPSTEVFRKFLREL
jgi:hypothetical protein